MPLRPDWRRPRQPHGRAVRSDDYSGQGCVMLLCHGSCVAVTGSEGVSGKSFLLTMAASFATSDTPQLCGGGEGAGTLFSSWPWGSWLEARRRQSRLMSRVRRWCLWQRIRRRWMSRGSRPRSRSRGTSRTTLACRAATCTSGTRNMWEHATPRWRTSPVSAAPPRTVFGRPPSPFRPTLRRVSTTRYRQSATPAATSHQTSPPHTFGHRRSRVRRATL